MKIDHYTPPLNLVSYTSTEKSPLQSRPSHAHYHGVATPKITNEATHVRHQQTDVNDSNHHSTVKGKQNLVYSVDEALNLHLHIIDSTNGELIRHIV